MILLVSYPRSGNTFIRNVLYEVFGVESATYHLEEHGPDADWQKFPVVKTHLLPHELPDELRTRTVIYLIRNGGDAVVSLAHHRKDIIDPKSNLEQNLEETIYASEGSHFGGWSHHVEQWIPKASAILHFENFIQTPQEAMDQIRPYLNLGMENWDKLPSFDDLKSGSPEYGSGKHLGKDLAQHWFRSGKVNTWQNDMTLEQSRLFWHLHGETMEFAGYSFDGSQGKRQYSNKVELNVLIEAEKLIEERVDGIKRYVLELLKTAQRFPVKSMNVQALVGGKVLSVDDALEMEGRGHKAIESGILFGLKRVAKSILPNKAYAQLARRFPIQKLRRTSSSPSSGLGISGYDVLHLTLPQHFQFAEKIDRHKTVVTIHDTTHHSHPEFHLANNEERTKDGFDFIRTNSSNCISVSESTEKDARQLGVSSTRVYEGVDRSRFYPLQNDHLLNLVRGRYTLPDKFILSLSTLEPRKNIQGLIEAYDDQPSEWKKECNLVLAGSKGWGSKLKVPESSIEFVHFIGFVREDHIAALYNLAHGFAYVSLYEGFGLPVLESLACGTPVLVSNTSSLPEVVGEVGFQCDPADTISISRGLHQLGDCHKAEMTPLCMEQSWKFSWKDCWLQTVEVYAQTTD